MTQGVWAGTGVVLSLLAMACGEASSAGGEGDRTTARVLLAEQSFATTLELSVVGGTGSAACRKAHFTTHFAPQGSSAQVVSGRDGSVLTGKVALAGSKTPSYQVDSAHPLTLPLGGDDCDLQTLQVTELSLRAYDTDGDGQLDRLEGTGKGQSQAAAEDVAYGVELTFKLDGVPDETRPSLLVRREINPLDGLQLEATEPLSLSSSVTLVGDGSPASALAGHDPEDGALGGFAAAFVAPFGATFRIDATGSDLAGLPLDTGHGEALTTLADPGLFAEDGFEGSPNVTLIGSAVVAGGPDNESALSGEKSLLVGANGSATLHLARPPGTTKLRFDARFLSAGNLDSAQWTTLEVGVIGSDERSSRNLTPATDPNQPEEVTVQLPDTGTELVLRISTSECYGPCRAPYVAQIDDLRVE